MGSQSKIAAMGFQVPKDQTLKKSIRRLRWFKSTFEEQISTVSNRTGIEFEIDNRALANCFVEWIRSFEALKPKDADHRLAYVGFTAGKMLVQLLEKQPLKVVEMPKASDTNLPEYFWPEGFAYVSYCLNIRQSVLREDFDADFEFAAQFDDIRTWWSFKENVADKPDYAISFLDLFAGQEPNWEMPGVFSAISSELKLGADEHLRL